MSKSKKEVKAEIMAKYDIFNDVSEKVARGIKPTATKLKELEEAKKPIHAKRDDIIEGKMSPPVSYQDSDQSPLRGEAAQHLRYQWSSGMDYNPVTTPYLSDWLKVLWCGDYQGMMDILRDKTEEETAMLIKKRESFLSVNAVFHVVIGAKVLCTHGEPDYQYVQFRAHQAFPNIKKEHVSGLRHMSVSRLA